MARAVAEEITNEFFEHISRKGRDCVEIAEKINRMIKTDDEYQRSMFEGMKAITAHMQKGGRVKCMSIPLEAGANEMFKELLRKYQVPYVAAVSGEPRKEHVFFRDKDARIVSMCRIELFNRLNFMCAELSPKDFFKKYVNDEIKGINGLDKGDIEFIRREIADKNEKSAEIDFSIVKDLKNEGKEMIIFPESKRELMEKIVDRVIYDFSGEEGKEKKEKVLEQVKEKNRFENIIKNNVNAGKEVCLVDSLNPSIFCLINEDGIQMHRLSKERDESGEFMIKDDMIASSNIKELHRFSSELYRPVLMSLKEMNLIKGMTDDGKIKTEARNYDSDLSILKKKTLIMPDKRKYLADSIIDSLRKPTEQEIKTYSHLSKEVLYTLEELIRQRNLKETVIEGDNVSCTETDLPVIDKFMREHVFRVYEPAEVTALTPLIEYELKYYHEGRGSINLTDKKKMKKEPQYLVDAVDERYLFKIDGENLTAYDANQEFLRISIDSEEFTESFMQLLSNLKEPVVLKTEDLYGKSKEEILYTIAEKRSDIKDYVSKDMLRSQVFYRNSKEYDEIDGKVPEMPTDKQKEAIEKINEYKSNTVVIKYSDETKAMYREPEREITVNTGKPEISF